MWINKRYHRGLMDIPLYTFFLVLKSVVFPRIWFGSLVCWCVYLFGDAAIFVQVVQVECPVESIINSPSQDDGQAKHKVLVQKRDRGLDFDRMTCGDISDIRSNQHELTSKLTEPFLFVSKASKRKCAYILESAKILSDPWCTWNMKHILWTFWIIIVLNIEKDFREKKIPVQPEAVGLVNLYQILLTLCREWNWF